MRHMTLLFLEVTKCLSYGSLRDSQAKIAEDSIQPLYAMNICNNSYVIDTIY